MNKEDFSLLRTLIIIIAILEIFFYLFEPKYIPPKVGTSTGEQVQLILKNK